MRSTVLLLAALIVSGLAGCAKPCAPNGPAPEGTQWTAHPDFIFAGGVVCGVREQGATVDYKTSTNPWVLAVDHFEAKGWQRSAQDADNKDKVMHVTFTKPGEGITVRFLDNGTYTRTIFDYSGPKR